MPASARYDREYFDRWYRDPKRRVLDGPEIARRARLVVAVAEYLLERPVRSVLDVGCGEGNWRAPLKALRPRLRYQGVDPSDYAVRRFGRSRNIVQGTAESLDALHLPARFDVIVASGVLNFLDVAALRRTLRHIAHRLDGVAFLEIFSSSDDVEGDTRGWRRQSADFYRREIVRAGLAPCGAHCYVTRAHARNLAALETLR
jgi:SAM-dependent methyltransferase